MNANPVRENPFSTRFVQPGAVPFLFAAEPAHDPNGDDTAGPLEALAERLLELGAGALVGPHGVGKSTLARALQKHFLAQDWQVEWIQLRVGQSWRPQKNWSASLTDRALVIIDGFEQLPFWRRWSVSRSCRRAGAILLTTCHRPLHLPVLQQVRPTEAVLVAVVGKLLNDDWSVIQVEDVRQCFQRHGDARETLFALYDVFEQRVRGSR